MALPDLTYPDPHRKIYVVCDSCGAEVAGAVRGSRDFRYVLKAIKAHEDEQHPPYDRRLIAELVAVVEAFNERQPTSGHVGRYSLAEV